MGHLYGLSQNLQVKSNQKLLVGFIQNRLVESNPKTPSKPNQFSVGMYHWKSHCPSQTQNSLVELNPKPLFRKVKYFLLGAIKKRC